MTIAREFWKRIETLHAVTYFAPESIAAAKTAGLRGFWMGYFGCRAAPLGAVNAGAVEAAFANFAPGMVRRSIPDAWNLLSPEHLIAVRSNAAAQALRRLAPDITRLATEVNEPIAKTLSEADTNDLVRRLTPAAIEISSSGVLPFPNPMGLPSLTAS